MAKDPVCNMNVDEKTAKHVSDINGNKVYFVLLIVNNSSSKILQNMDIDTNHIYSTLLIQLRFSLIFFLIDSILPRYFWL